MSSTAFQHVRLLCFIFSGAFIAYFLRISIKSHLTVKPEINPEEKEEGVYARRHAKKKEKLDEKKEGKKNKQMCLLDFIR